MLLKDDIKRKFERTCYKYITNVLIESYTLNVNASSFDNIENLHIVL